MRSLNRLTTSCDVGYFHWLKIILKLFTYMAVLMAEDKSRYNDMNTIYMKWTLASHKLSGYRSNSLNVYCFIHRRHHLELKWTLAPDHSLN